MPGHKLSSPRRRTKCPARERERGWETERQPVNWTESATEARQSKAAAAAAAKEEEEEETGELRRRRIADRRIADRRNRQERRLSITESRFQMDTDDGHDEEPKSKSAPDPSTIVKCSGRQGVEGSGWRIGREECSAQPKPQLD